MGSPDFRAAMLSLLLAFSLTQAIAGTYVLTFRGLSYSRTVVQTMAVTSIVTCMTILAAGNSIAAGLGIAGGMSAKLVIYPIAEGLAPGRKLTNWAIAAKIGENNATPPRREDWSRPGRFEDIMPYLKRFSLPYLDAQRMIEATPEFWEYPMCDRDPLPRWSHGRVTLLGDAAHPMYPVGSNGASQAILDARCLADLLKTAEHPVHALWAYEQQRLPPTAQIVRMNRKGGPEGVIDAVEERAPDGFTDIDTVLSFEERKAIVRGYASTAGFSQEKVNRKAA